MSLAKPQSPVFITEGVASDIQQVSDLGTNQNATLINQLHGIATTNAIGAGIPKQVSNVQVSVANAQTGSTCTVSILYRVDPTDKNFAGVNILVKGYQGNSQLVQVSSGVSSPTKFVLNNTGEIVSFTVQAYGNGGSAPLTGSPTCSGTLPQSTNGGFGSSTVTSPPPTPAATFQTQGVNNASQTILNIESIDTSILVTNPSGGDVAIQGPQYELTSPGWWSSGDGSNYAINFSLGGAYGTGNANEVKWWMVRIPVSVKVSKLCTLVGTAGSAGNVGGFAVYDKTGTTKLISFDNFTIASTGLKTASITPVTLQPGIYIFACACSQASASPSSSPSYQAFATSEGIAPWSNNGTKRSGTAANAMVAGVLPATLGAFSLGGGGFAALPYILMEP